uniref:Uncharacterized protein n=1 Tax=Siphoviridae sp. ctk5O4 TaxID=2827921 RepID=A0A8S5SK10_9CAUD|nr:MAG TPA: hypothetical protein [Siphoviridae sp. ctk5O4]
MKTSATSKDKFEKTRFFKIAFYATEWIFIIKNEY